MDRIEKLAIALRHAAFPGARSWLSTAGDVRERWIAAANCADMMVARSVDKALKQATANAHELGQHDAAKMLRGMRLPDSVEASTVIPDRSQADASELAR